MAFLNKGMMKNKAQLATVEEHPMLSRTEVDTDIKIAYVQGCVLGTLLDDGKVSEIERDAVRKLGLSLKLRDAEIDECIDVVTKLQDKDKNGFVDEILSVLKPAPFCAYFIEDFERILNVNGSLTDEVKELLEYFGQTLFSAEKWRGKVASAKRSKSGERKTRRGKGETSESSQLGDDDCEAKKKPVFGFGDKVWRTNPDKNGIECSFADAPSKSIRDNLKAAGFRWSKLQGLWWAKNTDKARATMQNLGLRCIDEKAHGLVAHALDFFMGRDESGVDSEESSEDGPITAEELIALIENEGIEVEVVDDENCYPVVKSATMDCAGDGRCSMTVTYGYDDDGNAGRLVFEVEGVSFSAERNFDGEHDEFEMSGREIVYGEDLDEEDVLRAVEENVDIKEFDPDDYEFDEDDVDVSALSEALESVYPDYFAVDGDDVYGYDDEDDIPEDYEQVDLDEAIEHMRDNGDIEYERE